MSIRILIISSMAILDKWGIHNEVCSLCKQENETRSHLLIQLVTLTFLLMGCQIMNQFAHSGQLSGSGANSNLQHQSSCNMPNNKDGAVSHFMKFQASKYTELQKCTSSGPSAKVQSDGANSAQSNLCYEHILGRCKVPFPRGKEIVSHI